MADDSETANTLYEPDLVSGGLPLNCTSNDIEIATATVTAYSFTGAPGSFVTLPAGEAVQCNEGETIYAVTEAQLQNNAQSRYDIGVWIATDGGDALTGSCLHFNLILGETGVADLDGPPPDEGDVCGDMAQDAGLAEVSLDTLQLTCTDNGEGFVEVGACIGWQNQINENQGAPRICTESFTPEQFRYATVPDNKAKCNCDPFELPIIVNQTAKLEVRKACVPTSIPGATFDLLIDGNVETDNAACGGTTGEVTVGAGTNQDPGATHTFAEGDFTTANYTTSWECHHDGGAAISSGTGVGPHNIDVEPDDDIVCIFTNTKKPSLKIIKDAVPNGPQDFDFDLTGTGVPADLDLDDDADGTLPNNQTFSQLTVGGTYTVTETTVSSHTLTNIACTGAGNSTLTIGGDSDFDAGDTGLSVTLGAGDDVVCTFTNTGNGSITIVKDAVPNAAQDFDFDNTGTGVTADLDLDDDADGTLPNSHTFSDLAAGSRSFTESAVAGWTLTNIACTGQSSSTITIGADSDFDAGDATVTVGLAQGENVTCTFTNTRHSVTVTKTAVETFTRGFTWGIVKTANPAGPIDLDPGQIYSQDYDIAVDTTGYTDSDWAVGGSITINNPNAFAVTINSVTDAITGVGAASVNCPQTLPYVLAGGGSLVCTYDATLPDGSTRTNTASVTLAGVADAFTDDESVNFSGVSPTAFEDNCLAVEDVWNGGAPETIGTVCVTGTTHPAGAQTAPYTFDMDKTIPTGAAQCGQVTYNNTATGTTNTSQTEVSDDASLVVNIACPEGCTLTQGYWKTHNPQFALARNGKGPPPDEAWNLITPAGALSGFFTTSNSYPVVGPNPTSFTWFQVFWTAPKGNAYYNLAHQYMAAKLNILDGVTPPGSVAAAITAAEDIFDSYTPAAIGALKGNNALRAQIIALAGTLGAFNEGTGGVEHCTEDATSSLQ